MREELSQLAPLEAQIQRVSEEIERRMQPYCLTRKANPYLRRDICQAAWAASHTKGTYLSVLYRRYRARPGHNKAVFAVAHQILITAYTMLSRGDDYRELGANYFDGENKLGVSQTTRRSRTYQCALRGITCHHKKASRPTLKGFICSKIIRQTGTNFRRTPDRGRLGREAGRVYL